MKKSVFSQNPPLREYVVCRAVAELAHIMPGLGLSVPEAAVVCWVIVAGLERVSADANEPEVMAMVERLVQKANSQYRPENES